MNFYLALIHLKKFKNFLLTIILNKLLLKMLYKLLHCIIVIVISIY